MVNRNTKKEREKLGNINKKDTKFQQTKPMLC